MSTSPHSPAPACPIDALIRANGAVMRIGALVVECTGALSLPFASNPSPMSVRVASVEECMP